jgi:hypothetical protein
VCLCRRCARWCVTPSHYLQEEESEKFTVISVCVCGVNATLIHWRKGVEDWEALNEHLTENKIVDKRWSTTGNLLDVADVILLDTPCAPLL